MWFLLHLVTVWLFDIGNADGVQILVELLLFRESLYALIPYLIIDVGSRRRFRLISESIPSLGSSILQTSKSSSSMPSPISQEVTTVSNFLSKTCDEILCVRHIYH
jgi:hypothetical protein